ncbi:MAG TPA: hypothetical protein DHV48_07790 [Prolixibacteraceae bacterium]|nr:hypothetical protein [Prolixibacteraceae bacterium]
MIWANINNDKVEAFPKGRALCDNCGKQVIAKCGEIKIWHWAHFNNPDCDIWHEPETDWHYHWKMTFGKENSEIVVRKEGKMHRADILTKEKVVIELQNSPISGPEINQREQFYGERMIWLVNGIGFKGKFKIDIARNRFPDINYGYELIWDEVKGEGKRIKIENPEPQPQRGKYDFIWNYNKQSWASVKRPVFIDFGGKELFWVKNGMGSGSGDGDFILKKVFIEKYNGDYNYFIQNHRFFQDDQIL